MFMRGGPNFICIHLQRVTQVIPRCRYVSIKIVKSTKEDRLERLRLSQYFKNVESFLIIIFRSCNKLTIITPSNTD